MHCHHQPQVDSGLTQALLNAPEPSLVVACGSQKLAYTTTKTEAAVASPKAAVGDQGVVVVDAQGSARGAEDLEVRVPLCVCGRTGLVKAQDCLPEPCS
jgi:hypothetical protein